LLVYNGGMVALVDDPVAVQAVAHPVRLRILEVLRAPDSAAGIARRLGVSRQGVNYHLKELERAGLVRSAGERRTGNFIEQLFEPAARVLVISPRLTLGARRLSVLKDQVSLERLVALGEQIERDAAVLLDEAAFENREVPSASVTAEVRFAGAEQRSAFMRDYLEAMGPLLKKYGSSEGERFQVAVAVYPKPEEE
jgi:DNA-binding transcriptional ArsR family regulator